MISSPASEGWRYYVRLAANSFATMLDLGLFALGAALVGLGVAAFLSSFGIVAGETDLSTGAALVSALVLGVVGTFAMGIASEGPVRRTSRLVVNSDLVAAATRAVSSVLVGILFVFVAGRVRPLVGDLPAPIGRGVELIKTAGVAGLWPVPLIGVPLAWGVKRSGLLGESAVEADLPVLFAVWVVALILLR